ncbi:MAG TPA: translocation/assembly module TamB domain-containing protein [Bryobacteraceae bacterium]
MSRRNRMFLTVGAVLCGVVAVSAIGAWLILRSNWLRNEIRERIVSELERATGGRVELGGFDYDWHTLTAEFRNLTVHGSEPSGAAPLLAVDRLQINLKIVSLLNREVDISSLQADRPRINLLVDSGGATNIPTPRRRRRKGALEELLDWKVRHFELNDGTVQLNDRRWPLALRGEELALLLTYRADRPRYEVALSSREMRISSSVFGPLSLKLATRAQLERDRVIIQQLTLAKDSSNLEASGVIRNLAQPIADFKVKSSAAVDDLALAAHVQRLQGGRVSLEGTAHYDESAGLSFTGKAGAREVAYVTRPYALKDLNFDSDVAASARDLIFKHLFAYTRGERFNGEAALKHYRDFSLDGQVSGLTLRDAASHLNWKPLAWSGIAHGHIHATANLSRQTQNFTLQAQMQVAPTPEGIPISGDIGIAYHSRGNSVNFANSHLNFPHSELTFSGALEGKSQLRLDSTNLSDLEPALDWISPRVLPVDVPVLLENGTAHFDGTISGLPASPSIAGQTALSHFRMHGEVWDQLRSQIAAGAAGVDFSSLDLQQGAMRIRGSGSLALDDWSIRPDGALRADAQFQGVDIVRTIARFSTVKLPIIRGAAAGRVRLAGSMDSPQGDGHISIDSLDAYGERINQVQFDASLRNANLEATHGRVQSGAASLSFSGVYRHDASGWRQGEAEVKIDSNGFPLASLTTIRKYEPGLTAQAEVHLQAAARIAQNQVEPLSANGLLEFHHVTINHIALGNLSVHAATRGRVLSATLAGDLRESPLHGAAQVQLIAGTPLKGEVRVNRITLTALYGLTGSRLTAPVDGFLEGGLQFEGPLEQPERLHVRLEIDRLQASSQIKADALAKTVTPDFVLNNAAPIVVDASGGVAVVRSFQISGKDTSLSIKGSVPYLQTASAMHLEVEGSVNLRIFHFFDPNVNSAGASTVSATITGTLRDPAVNGALALKNGSFFLENVPNGLSDVTGAVTFNRNRATLQKMTATSGGGQISLGGFVSFGGGGPLVYHLEEVAESVRVRYAGSISVTANSRLRLSGTSASSILSGTLTILRVAFNPNTDVGNLLASLGATSAAPTSENEFLSGLRLDINVESAPNLQLSTALSRDVEAEINLRLRGTPDHPILLGSVAANQGDIKVFGTRYTINRGEVNFLNSVKMEPVLDLDLETEARGITVDITVSGTFGKLNINYRSDPPLQPKDIIALLTVGRAPSTAANVNNARTVNDASSLQSGANTVLGAAMSPVSNRLSKLFGITNIKIDPLVQGITNSPQARLTLEQQISRDITVTYVTNLSQTSEQIFRLEWALSRQFSLVALRDDNGEFGIDFQYKKRFK